MTNANTEPVWKPQAERKRSGMYAPTNWHSFEDGGSEEVYFNVHAWMLIWLESIYTLMHNRFLQLLLIYQGLYLKPSELSPPGDHTHRLLRLLII